MCHEREWKRIEIMEGTGRVIRDGRDGDGWESMGRDDRDGLEGTKRNEK